MKEMIELEILSEAPINMLQQMHLPALGILTSNVETLDKKYHADESEIKANAKTMCLEQESKGKGSMHSQWQPFSCPDIEDLIGKRINVLCSVELNANTTVLKWCQGKVKGIIGDTRVENEWDPEPGIEGCKESTVGKQVLLLSKWNNGNKDSTWRMDVDIDVENEIDDESDEEDEVEFIESDIESEDDCDIDN